MANRDTALARHIAIALTLLVIYASLYPFSGWRELPAPAFGWLNISWPRYWTRIDNAMNILGYVPFGFLWATVLQRRCGRIWVIPLVALLGALLSGTIETVQNYLPSRVPSNLDLANNSIGALLGATLGARWGGTLLSGGRLAALRERHVIDSYIGDTGLVLMGLWLLTQITPESLLFGNGDLRRVLGITPTLPFDIERFARIEAAIAGINTLAFGLVLRTMGLRMRYVFAALLTGLAIRTLAAAILVEPGNALHWLTQGNATGVAAGAVVLMVLRWIPPVLHRPLAAVSLLLSTVLVNLAPENPYLAEAVSIWRKNHFLNFNGLTRLVSMLWPFLALAWLLLPERNPWKSTHQKTDPKTS